MIIFRKVIAILGQLTRDIFRAINGKRDLIRLRNRCKLVERSLFAIIDLLQGAKTILLNFIWRVGGRFSLKNSNFREKKVHNIILHLIFCLPGCL